MQATTGLKRRTSGERVFDVFNVLFMILLVLIMLYPMYYVLMASFSVPSQFAAHRGLLLTPLGFQTDAYKIVFENPDILTGYKNTLFYVILGTAMNMFLTIVGGYVLSRKGPMLNTFFTFFIMLTMFFSGGMVPTYLMISQIGLMGTRGAVLLPGLVNTTNLIIMRTGFQGIPEAMEESARIDGANDWTILTKIMIPLAMPTIAVIILFYGVGHWNSWFNASIYLRDNSKFPLQLFLRQILVQSGTDDMIISYGSYDGQDLSEIIKYTTIIVSTVPILLVYPFLQKHFTQGVMIGAVKG